MSSLVVAMVVEVRVIVPERVGETRCTLEDTYTQVMPEKGGSLYDSLGVREVDNGVAAGIALADGVVELCVVRPCWPFSEYLVLSD